MVLAGTTLFTGLARAQTTYEVLHAFENPGRFPARTALVEDDDGHLYGTTLYGGHAGVDGGGTFFRMDPDGTLTTLHHFDCGPSLACYPGGLIRAGDGFFYGTTAYGGAADGGTIFRIDRAGALTTLHAFDCSDGEGCAPVLFLQAADGFLYGSAGNVLFRMDTAGHFTSAGAPLCNPYVCGLVSGLMQKSDGFFYGTTTGNPDVAWDHGGSLFRMDDVGAVTLLHEFRCAHPHDACLPIGGLVEGRDGFLYGLTGAGGEASGGTAFRMDGAGNIVILHSFDCSAESCNPSSPLVPGRRGAFYGTTRGYDFDSGGAIFRMDRNGKVKTLFSSFDCNGPDGCLPGMLMQASNGRIYGTTGFGAAGDDGTVFTMPPSGRVKTLHAFGSTAEGSCPAGLLQAGDGMLYGTTSAGGRHGFGTLFSVDPSGVITTLHSFDCTADGCQPSVRLIQAVGGDLYGITSGGGAAEAGTVFRMTTRGAFSVVHAFDRLVDGSFPVGLTQARDGDLYGTTQSGGVAHCGTVFRLSPEGVLTLLHSFDCSTEGFPLDGVVQTENGDLYGTTNTSIYRIDRAGTYDRIARLPCSGHCWSRGLVQWTDGLLYGTTAYGGASDGGFIYRTGASGNAILLHSFDCDADGCNPMSELLPAAEALYGTTFQGGGDPGELVQGTLYSIDAAGTFTVLHRFACLTDGCQPIARPLQADDGSLYGSTPRFGPGGGGVVFRLIVPGR
ncbi:MAG TPA: choice-of-anchor tandem repeat GloVer-containing protein [Candidatus Polarisedimenticolia bacterium]|nr:choice-of-anchor tandem repeat GloVer-containing protein [Candidatus Polarisedimenticolia bacterium]